MRKKAQVKLIKVLQIILRLSLFTLFVVVLGYSYLVDILMIVPLLLSVLIFICCGYISFHSNQYLIKTNNNYE